LNALGEEREKRAEGKKGGSAIASCIFPVSLSTPPAQELERSSGKKKGCGIPAVRLLLSSLSLFYLFGGKVGTEKGGGRSQKEKREKGVKFVHTRD